MKGSMRFVAMIGVIAGVALAGCSSKITDEQLARIRQLRQEESTLRQQIKSKQDEKSRLQGEINRLRADLDQCSKDRAFVQSKLAQWPDVWPDWKYVPPTAAPTQSRPRR